MALSINSLASGPTLKIIIVPAAHKLQYSSNKNLISSFLRSQALALRENDLQDASRKAIGHIVAKIDCSSHVRWTGISINPKHMISPILKNGFEGMFLPSPRAYMQTEEEIKKFIVNNSKKSIVMKFSVDQQACNEMMKMDDVHRSQNDLWFGPLLDTHFQYMSGAHLGGSGSTYAIALKQLAGTNDVDFRRWLEIIQLPGIGKKISFYSVQSMWDFAISERKSFPARNYLEEISYKHRKVKIDGIEF